MSKTMFTPGPWLREGNTVYAVEPCGWRKGVEQFRNRFWFSVSGGPETPPEEVAAVAVLAQASPDLLAACESVLQALETCGYGGNNKHAEKAHTKTLRSAITKATTTEGTP